MFGGSTTAIDQLAYVYTTGNQLTTVTDNSSYYNQADNNPNYGFSEITHAAITEYTYDDNGSMTSDLNKGITSITYNYLNKPAVVTLASPTRTLTFTYDATGNKLKKLANNNGTQVAQSDYVGPIQYEGTTTSSLAFMSMPEGRVVKAGANWNYEYFLKDHLGNNRVVFAYTNQTDEYKATMETEAATAEEAQFQNLPATRLNLVTYNHTSKSYLSPTPTRVAETNGYTSKTIGPAKMLQVHTGDTVQASVFARYTTGTGGSTAIVNNLLTAVTGAYGILGTDAAYTGFSNNLPTISGSLGAYSNVPKAYLIYILFNSTFTSYQFGYQMVSSAAMAGHEKLSANVTVTSPYNNGYLYVYMANESNVAGASSVYFDDVYVKHIKATKALQVTQTNDYFPFGMGINSLAYQKGTKFKNSYLYNGKELNNDFSLGLVDYGTRMYQPDIGRFTTIDPLTTAFPYLTPYQYASNDPAGNIDMDGLEGTVFFSIDIMAGDGLVFAKPPPIAEPLLRMGEISGKSAETIGRVAEAVKQAESAGAGSSKTSGTWEDLARWTETIGEKIEKFVQHHLNPNEFREDPLTQMGRKGGFKYQGRENKMPVEQWRNSPNHPEYNNTWRQAARNFEEQHPNYTPRDAAQWLRDWANSSRESIKQNPTKHINEIKPTPPAPPTPPTPPTPPPPNPPPTPPQPAPAPTPVI